LIDEEKEKNGNKAQPPTGLDLYIYSSLHILLGNIEYIFDTLHLVIIFK